MLDILKFQNRNPWPVSTVTLISIIFTPAIGGIIAGINQQRFGFIKNSRKEYIVSLLSFLLYAISLSPLPFVESPYSLALFVPPLALLYAIRALPEIFLAFVILPSALIISGIHQRQKKSWEEWHKEQKEQAPWWQAYILGFLFTIPVGLLLFLAATWGVPVWYYPFGVFVWLFRLIF